MKTFFLSLALLIPQISFAGHYHCQANKDGIVLAQQTFDTLKDGRNKILFAVDGYTMLATWSGGGINSTELGIPDFLIVTAHLEKDAVAMKSAAWGENLDLFLGKLAVSCQHQQ